MTGKDPLHTSESHRGGLVPRQHFLDPALFVAIDDGGERGVRYGPGGHSSIEGSSMSQASFFLSAFDLDRWCSVLETRFTVDDIAALQTIIDPDIDADPEFAGCYIVEPGEMDAINQRFEVGFDPARLKLPEVEIWLERERKGRSIRNVPYLVHTNFELPLMLEGRKKLARFTDVLPRTEEAFDRWVEKGVFHKEVFVEPIPESLIPYLIDPSHRAVRDVYYTLKGEEWRIPAMNLLWKAGVGWNEYFERLEGMLFGYEDWQIDWWIAHRNEQSGGIGGVSFCCTVDSEGLKWMELAGFKALPPFAEIQIQIYDPDEDTVTAALFAEDESAVALARFKLSLEMQRRLLDGNTRGPWQINREQIPEINRHLKRQVDVLLRQSAP
ncbi:hypothetical protein [Rhizobium ruizarguesonis]|uniref:hypothetical protein n=1 Tax=Rhizobium ruizarguesonis TaxID=2081791 RepID=UPI00102F56CF|nr:hypothetical protein [Rhizobium ruizarguesonis]TBD09791.1 hypothetical protein ELH23_32790 [Rhizobium ruizarguesonis]